jgi:hypothetical protein
VPWYLEVHMSQFGLLVVLSSIGYVIVIAQGGSAGIHWKFATPPLYGRAEVPLEACHAQRLLFFSGEYTTMTGVPMDMIKEGPRLGSLRGSTWLGSADPMLWNTLLIHLNRHAVTGLLPSIR